MLAAVPLSVSVPAPVLLNPKAPLLDITDEDWHRGLEVYFLNVVRPTRLVTPVMYKLIPPEISPAPASRTTRTGGTLVAPAGATPAPAKGLE